MADTEYTKGYRAGYDFARAETETRIIKMLLDGNHPLGRELYDHWEWQDEDHQFPYGLIKGEK